VKFLRVLSPSAGDLSAGVLQRMSYLPLHPGLAGRVQYLFGVVETLDVYLRKFFNDNDPPGYHEAPRVFLAAAGRVPRGRCALKFSQEHPSTPPDPNRCICRI
jgi:hypothetical protein